MAVDPVTLSDMPTVEGLRFRHVRGEEDAEALHLVHAGRIARDQVDLWSTCEGLSSRDEFSAALARLVAAQQQHLRLVAEVDEQVVGYSLIETWLEQDGRWVYLILG